MVTDTLTQRAPRLLVGRDTVSELALRETMVPLPADPKDTAVALARPPPEMVMAPEPLMDPVFGLRPATDGQPSPPCSVSARFGSTGEPSPLAAL